MKKILVHAICYHIYLRKLFGKSETWFKTSGICFILALALYIFKIISELDMTAHFWACSISILALLTAGVVRYGERLRKAEWDRNKKMLFT